MFETKQIPLKTDKPYFINTNGEIQGLKSWGHCSQNSKEYKRVGLMMNGKQRLFYVHRLVALTFHGEIDGKCVCHKNDIGTDNHIDNLKISTIKVNQTHDRKANGTYFNRGAYCPF